MQKRDRNNRCFSIELNSKHQIRNITITEDQKEGALIEGTIGNLIKATFSDGVVFEVIGTKGTLRLELQAKEVKESFKN